MNALELVNELKHPVIQYNTCFNSTCAAVLAEVTVFPFDLAEVVLNEKGECVNLKHGDGLRDFNWTENGNFITLIRVYEDRVKYTDDVIDYVTGEGDCGVESRNWALARGVSRSTWYNRTRVMRCA